MMPASKRLALLAKALLSLWILYHLFVVVVMSNPGSFLERNVRAWLAPYANITGFNTSWNFFAPDPASTMYFHYWVHFENDRGEPLKEPVEGFLPQDKNTASFDVRRRRELYLMHYFFRRPERLESLFVPHLCKEHPGATTVRIEFMVETIAPLDEARIFKDEAMSDLSKQLELIKREYPCHVD